MAERMIYLVRHGCTSSSYAGKYVGTTDVPLSAKGVAQLQALAAYHRDLLNTMECCDSSPLARCRHSTALLMLPSGCVPTYRPELCEINFGQWEGLSSAEISERDPTAWQQFLAAPSSGGFPGGESQEQFRQRLGVFFAKLQRRDVQHTLVVCHAGVIRQLICMALDISHDRQFVFEIPPSSLTTLRLYGDNSAVLVGLGDTCHLRSTHDKGDTDG